MSTSASLLFLFFSCYRSHGGETFRLAEHLAAGNIMVFFLNQISEMKHQSMNNKSALFCFVFLFPKTLATPFFFFLINSNQARKKEWSLRKILDKMYLPSYISLYFIVYVKQVFQFICEFLSEIAMVDMFCIGNGSMQLCSIY